MGGLVAAGVIEATRYWTASQFLIIGGYTVFMEYWCSNLRKLANFSLKSEMED